ncbi:NAC domain [Macleaya cordata]|uniref:NAC domain n=1 Tax=Macleaya cordata TaxID=56857 RepID=A0A200R0Z5_MACCD|nr:NAC domain [Macleaya cordata]
MSSSVDSIVDTDDDAVEAYLAAVVPKGFIFKPTDKELVLEYLTKKILNQPLPPSRIKSVNIYEYNPEALIDKYKEYGKNEWYFFTPRAKRYPNGSRPNRTAGDGYWKATVAETKIYRGKIDRTVIGLKKTLVFHYGKPPNGLKTNWIMHEFVASDQITTAAATNVMNNNTRTTTNNSKKNSCFPRKI